MPTKVYLDYAAATPVDSDVLASMQPFFTEHFYNPSGLALASKYVSRSIEESRQIIARSIGALESEIIFTAGGTEANNLAIRGVLEQFPGKKLAISSIEHDSVLQTASQYTCTVLPVNMKGRIDIARAKSLIDDETIVVSIIYASNEIGTIQPIAKLAALMSEVRKDRQARGVDTPVYFHIDACQAFYLDLQVARLGVDLMTCNGGKLYGPKQSGFLYVRTGTHLRPLLYGGGQEMGLRSGTENVAAIIGLATAFKKIRHHAIEEKERLQQLRNTLQSAVIDLGHEVIIHGDSEHRLPHHLSCAFIGVDNERLLMMLDEKGIIAGAGSACHATNSQPSTVLAAIGVERSVANNTIRFTLGKSTTKQSIAYTVDVLKRLLPEAKKLS